MMAGLTLGDVLGRRGLGLRLLTGGPEALARPVAGAHAIEIAHPTRWLAPDWIMLTTGLRLRGRADEQRRLVAELHDGGQAGLGLGLGLGLTRVPRALLEEAQRRGLPLFVIPIETPFRDIVSSVNDSLAKGELQHMRRLMDVQEHLMDALRLEDPRLALVDRLAGVLDADVALERPDGTVLAAARRCARATTVAGTPVSVPVPVGDREDGRLVVALPTRPAGDRLAGPVVRHAARLLGVVARAYRLEVRAERLRRAELLLAVLSRPGPERLAGLREEAGALGLDFAVPARAVAWSVEGRADDVVGALGAALHAAGLPHLLAARHGWVAGVVQGAADDDRLVPGEGLRAGVGRPVHGLEEVEPSLADARAALAHAQVPEGPRIARFERLDPASLLLAASPDPGAAERMAALLEPLRPHPVLLATLRCYFEANLQVGPVATRLSLHRNTLRYRLGRIEALLGMPLDAPASIANLHMALLGQRLLRRG